MGCGQSRFIPGTQALPTTLRPLFRLHIHEIRRHNSLQSSNLSKKLLLIKDDDSSARHSVHEDNSMSSSSSSKKKLVLEEKVKVAPVPEPDEKPREPKENLDRNGSSKGCKTDIEEKREKEVVEMVPTAAKKDMVVVEKTEELKVVEKEKINNGEEEEERESVSDLQDRCIWPGSPSFRVFFDEANQIPDDCKDSDTDETLPAEDKSVSSENSNEVSEASVKKTRKRRKHFMRVRPAVRNLLNVTSCYNPANCTGHRKPHPLPPRST